MSKRGNRVDSNHVEIVNGLRKWGASVQSIASIGRNVPDLIIGWRDINFLVEVKTDKGELSDGQVEFIKDWKGEIFVGRSLEAIIKFLETRCGSKDYDYHN